MLLCFHWRFASPLGDNTDNDGNNNVNDNNSKTELVMHASDSILSKHTRVGDNARFFHNKIFIIELLKVNTHINGNNIGGNHNADIKQQQQQ